MVRFRHLFARRYPGRQVINQATFGLRRVAFEDSQGAAGIRSGQSQRTGSDRTSVNETRILSLLMSGYSTGCQECQECQLCQPRQRCHLCIFRSTDMM